jgi:hypothetical protein
MKRQCLSFVTTVIAACFLASASLAADQSAPIAADDAAQHVGEVQTVQATVADTAFLAKSKDQPTFLNLDRPFPSHTLTVLIPGQARSKFASAPEEYYKGKQILVTGKIETRGQKYQIVVSDPAQVKVVDATASASAK